MGADIKLYLAPSVRIGRLAIAMGALHGLPVEKDHTPKYHADETEFFTRCPSVKVVPTSSVGMYSFEFTTPHGEGRHIYFHYEPDGNTPLGGKAATYRLLSMRSSARNVAIAKRLLNIFGGRAVFNDCGSKTFDEPDMKVKANRLNAANDGKVYYDMQRLLASITPLTQNEIAACASEASYDYNPSEATDMGFDNLTAVAHA